MIATDLLSRLRLDRIHNRADPELVIYGRGLTGSHRRSGAGQPI
ncbi:MULTISPECIES: hypothetical protein [Pseudofrankia]|nr:MULTISPECIES: hypothetical protein [Pseudofrankia]